MKFHRDQSKLLLYGTSGCHLCEQAEQLIRRKTTWFDTIEIADDAELLEQYGVRIPVVRRVDGGEELNWPFDEHAVEQLLAG